ncbi:ATP-dependent dethiobiotin synthetase BioD [Streptomyces lunaelactis]|uniref:dethiobiotin synthase n=1 Tax=Streptomyces lunaelactis TaxID=1535768 RepID=UPI0015856FA1|nr:dethiobiotin synthase [Streptomyces lunaelactis]NUL02501.1 ATP-dependent dethiobiotin synthetase BioD [Streptomyces lunaelactis]
MAVIVVTGTGTEVGKTVVTAALAAVARAQGLGVAVVKPAQTGVGRREAGDVDEVRRLVGDVAVVELARYPEPLAPATAARRAGMDAVRPQEVVEAVEKLAGEHDLVLVEGAGGLLVRLDEDGGTLADVARLLGAPVLVVAAAGLGTLNATALTGEALRARELEQLGVVVGSWPGEPDLAARCNLADLPEAAGAPLLGAVPAGVGTLATAEFRARAGSWLAPLLGGSWDADVFPADTFTADTFTAAAVR